MRLTRYLLILFLFQEKILSSSESMPPVATFSIVGHDPKTGDLGVAVASKFFGVGSVVPWAKAGVGAVATQSYANVEFGPDGLARMAEGQSAPDVLEALLQKDSDKDRRQAAMVDAKGKVGVFTGAKCLGWAGHVQGEHFSAQGNILVGEEVVQKMAEAFRGAQKVEGSELADWLMAALEAGDQAGGDKRGRQSAAILVVRSKGGYAGKNDRYVDVRVDDHTAPVTELKRLMEVHRQFYNRPSSKSK